MSDRGGGPILLRGRCGVGVWILLLAGCSSTPSPPMDTGAREVVRGYCEALLQRDWQRAYAALHPDSRAWCSSERFARLAAKYRHDLGFEPEPVHVRFCQERATRAIAHIVWKGQKASRECAYKDAIVLRQTPQGWGVVLPHSFGGGRLTSSAATRS